MPTLRELRESKQWTQEFLAEKSRVSLRAYTRLETGRGRPLFGTVSKVAATLGMSLDEMRTILGTV